jgi:arsenate reductase
VRAADVVITMSCGDTCPIFTGKRYEDWPVDDHAGQDLDTIWRSVRSRRLRESDRQSVVYVVAEVQIGVGVGAGRRHLVPRGP